MKRWKKTQFDTIHINSLYSTLTFFIFHFFFLGTCFFFEPSFATKVGKRFKNTYTSRRKHGRRAGTSVGSRKRTVRRTPLRSPSFASKFWPTSCVPHFFSCFQPFFSSRVFGVFRVDFRFPISIGFALPQSTPSSGETELRRKKDLKKLKSKRGKRRKQGTDIYVIKCDPEKTAWEMARCNADSKILSGFLNFRSSASVSSAAYI